MTAASLWLGAGLLVAACGAGQETATTPPPAAGPSATTAPSAVPQAAGEILAGPPQGAGNVNPAPLEPDIAHVPKDLPLGVSRVLYAISVPADRVPTAEQAKLGDKLFDDKRLSSDGTVACNTCHDPKRGFVDHLPTSEGVGKQRGQRNAPTILNAMFNATQFWDGRAATLEDQAKLPILNPIEMGMKSPENVVDKIRSIPEYAEAFRRIYGHDATFDDFASAVAAFERMQYTGDSPFDRFIAGDENAIDASAKRGWALFNGKARCNACHAANATSSLFSDQKFHNIGIAAHKPDFSALARKALAIVQSGNDKQIDELVIQTNFSELGRFMITKSPGDIGAFRTPNLRNIAITGPYMHDGSMDTLWDVMDHYNKGGVPNPFLDGGMQRLGLTEPEIDDVVHFLTTLTTDRFQAYAQKEMARQTSRKNVRPQRDTAAAMGKTGDLGDVGVDPNLTQKNPATEGAFGPVPSVSAVPAPPAPGAPHGH